MKIYIRPEIEINEVESKDIITESSWLNGAIGVITGAQNEGNKDLNISEGTDKEGNSSVTVSGNAGWFV